MAEERPFFKSLRGKIIMQMLVLSMLPMLIIGIPMYINMTTAQDTLTTNVDESRAALQRDTIASTMASQAWNLSLDLETWIAERIREVDNWAATAEVIEAAMQGHDKAGAAQSYLLDKVGTDPSFGDAYILDSVGNKVTQANPWGDTGYALNQQAWVVGWSNGLYVSDAYLATKGGIFSYYVDVAVLIEDHATLERLGVLVGSVVVLPLYFATEYGAKVPESRLMILARDGRIITDTENPDRYLNELPDWSEAEEVVYDKVIADDSILIKPDYVITEDIVAGYARATNNDITIQFENFEGLGWAVMVEKSADEALAPLDSLEEMETDLENNNRNVIFWLIASLGAVFLLALLASIFMSRGITNPIMNLYRGVIEVMGGNLDHKVGSEGQDEIGQLSRAFDDMTAAVKGSKHELEEYSANLEKMVEERTHELKQEVNDRKRAEEEIRNTAEKLNIILESMEDGVAVVNMIGDIMDLNTAYVRLLGYGNKEELLDKTFLETVSEKDSDKISEAMEKAIEQESSMDRMEFMMITHDGTEIAVEMSPSTLKDTFGDIMGFVFVLRDVTERREMEKKVREQTSMLIQSEKMSSVGTMVAGVAHELNNPLTGIINYGQYCMKRTEESDKRYSVLEDIVKEARRCTEIVRNMLTFSRKEAEGEEGYQKESISALVDRTLGLMAYRIRAEHVNITQNLGAEIPEVSMKVNSIQQILLNLIGNAIDALQDKENKEIKIEGDSGGGFIEVRIVDNGPGISEEVLKKIFEPFYTTKPVGKGTGLGLSISQSICKQHGGDLICESQVGVGTTFKIRLPIERDQVM